MEENNKQSNQQTVNTIVVDDGSVRVPVCNKQGDEV